MKDQKIDAVGREACETSAHGFCGRLLLKAMLHAAVLFKIRTVGRKEEE